MIPVDYVYGEDMRSGTIQMVNVRGNKRLNVLNVPIGRQLAVSNIFLGAEGNHISSNPPIFTALKLNQRVDYSSDFHIFKMEWTKDGFKFYVDGEMAGELEAPYGGMWKLSNFKPGNNSDTTQNYWASGTKMAPFDQPVYLSNI